MNPLRRVPPSVTVAVALAAMVVAVYWRLGSFPFISLDDENFIVRNPALHGGFSMEGLRWAFTTDMDAGWIPVTWLSRMADVSLFGMDAGKHHLVNVLFHLLNTLLLFHVLWRMSGKFWESVLVAALFAVHPLHVESVAWVTERKDVLGGFFFFLSLWGYARYAKSPGVVRYGTVTLFFVLGLLSKPILVTFPFVLLLLDYWPLGRLCLRTSREPDGWQPLPFHPASLRRLILEKVPLFALSAAVSVVTYRFQENIQAIIPLRATPLWARVANAMQSYAAYLGKAAFPSGLAFYYPHPGTRLLLWKTLSSAMLLGTITVLVVRHLRIRPWLAVGWFWFLGTLVPVLGLIRVGTQAMADRCAYLPLIGIYVISAWGLGELATRIRIPKPLTAGLAVAWLLGLGTCAWSQVGYWQGSGSLYRHALEVTKGNWLAHSLLGELAHRAGRGEEVVSHYREALRIRPDYPEAYNNLGVYMSDIGRYHDAVASLREALRILPNYAEAHYNLGVTYGRMGRVADAVDQYREALEIRPDDPKARNNLGVHLSESGRDAEAVAQYLEAIRIRPDYAEAHHNLGMALSRGGALDEATAHLREAVRLQPDYAKAHNNLGVLLARQGAFREAVSEFREALRLEADYPGARQNLDTVLNDMGRIPPEAPR